MSLFLASFRYAGLYYIMQQKKCDIIVAEPKEQKKLANLHHLLSMSSSSAHF